MGRLDLPTRFVSPNVVVKLFIAFSPVSSLVSAHESQFETNVECA